MFNKLSKQLILFLLLIYPFSFISANENLKKQENSFPNFGYWEHIDLTKISKKTEEKSQKDLYRYVLDHLELYDDDKILEIAIDKGLAAKIINDEYASDIYIGIDASFHKVKQAQKLNVDLIQNSQKYKYLVANADKMPFSNSSFSRLFSVGATHSFYSFEKFVKESDRVLKQNGKIVIAAPFAKNKQSASQLNKLFQSSSPFALIDEAYKAIKSQEFVDVHVEPIGKYVFDGFDKWLIKDGSHDDFWLKIKKAYDEGLVDYYVISAYKPVELIRM